MFDVARENKRIIDRVRRKGQFPSRYADVVFAARGNLFSQPGGDTEVAINLKSALTEEGYRIDYRTDLMDLSHFGMAHIFNFEGLMAIQSALLQKPFVVTPMYEDYGRYHTKSMKVVSLFKDYLGSGDSQAFEKELPALSTEEGCTHGTHDVSFVASQAEAIFVTGESEGNRIKRDFPEAKHIEVVKVGFNKPSDLDRASPRPFISEYGVRDFVLCVGRLETRKNQLMLLYALRNEDIPIVFVNGKTIQPGYEELCKRFRRKGKTIYTGRIPEELLSSAYMAAKVHALPSWYELPGLVSLEAAWFGCNVVASSWGTIRDYLGDHAYYCEPHDPHSVKKAVLAALSNRPDPGLLSVLREYTWRRQGDRVSKVYRRVISQCRTNKGIRRLRDKAKLAQRELSFQQFKEKARVLAQRNPREALEITSHMLGFEANDGATHFIRGLAYLTKMNHPEAEFHFKSALDLQPCSGTGSSLYLSLALLAQEKFREVVEVLEDALRIHPFAGDDTRLLIYEYLIRAYEGLGNGEKILEIKRIISTLDPIRLRKKAGTLTAAQTRSMSLF